MKLKNILCAIVLIAGAIVVIAELLGPRAYWFNFIYFIGIAPACIAISDWGKTIRPDLYERTGTAGADDSKG